MNDSVHTKNQALLHKITKDRERTNILKKYEQQILVYLVQRMPSWITSNMLTGIGFAGSVVVLGSFALASYFQREWLLLGILGYAIVWFGDSLDGRLAYFRNRPRKWYGYTLDFVVDWLAIILMGAGYILYLSDQQGELVGFGFVVLYGWSMMIASVRYKLTNRYSIDSGKVGPTEVRIIICLALILEVIVKGSILYFGIGACIVLLILNIDDFRRLLKTADQLDKEEKAARESKDF